MSVPHCGLQVAFFLTAYHSFSFFLILHIPSHSSHPSHHPHQKHTTLLPFNYNLVSPSNPLNIPSISPQYPLAGLSQTFQPETTASERKQPETAQKNRKPQKTTGNRRKPHETTENRTKQLYPKENNLIQHNPTPASCAALPLSGIASSADSAYFIV